MFLTAHTFVISGLRRKRARMAGAIEAAERNLAERREELASLDAVIRLFSPQSEFFLAVPAALELAGVLLEDI
jgi:hypothetical protein